MTEPETTAMTPNPNPASPVAAARPGRRALWLLPAAAVLTLAACAPAPRYAVRPAPAVPLPSTQVYFYPLRGQSPAQQDRDRYECYLWARQQTGFDPSATRLAPHQRYEVVAMPPSGSDAAAGAAAGALFGAIASGPGHAGRGAVLGGIAGAVIGGISDAARQEQAEQLEESYAQRDRGYSARVEEQAASYRRAMAACLEGRGYTVR
jgi:hypothetical protein